MDADCNARVIPLCNGVSCDTAGCVVRVSADEGHRPRRGGAPAVGVLLSEAAADASNSGKGDSVKAVLVLSGWREVRDQTAPRCVVGVSVRCPKKCDSLSRRIVGRHGRPGGRRSHRCQRWLRQSGFVGFRGERVGSQQRLKVKAKRAALSTLYVR